MVEESAVPNEAASTGEGSGGPRMRTAVVVVVAQAAAFAYALRAPDLIQNALGYMVAPALAFLILSIWWLRSKTVARRDRLNGFALIILLAILVSALPGAGAGQLLPYAAPVVLIGVVALLAATSSLAWPRRKGLVLLYLIACGAFFSLLRVDDVGGDLMPITAWRWEPYIGEWTDVADASGTAAIPAAAGPSDWPEFRGTARDNRLAGVTFATGWTATPPREIWRTRVGLGWSSFTVVGDYFFTQEQRDRAELIVCYEADTGEQIWTNKTSDRFNDSTGDGPRATPTFYEGELYVLGATGLLQRLEPASGKTLWTHDLKDDAKAKIPRWGFASSPLVVGDLVVVFAGGPDGKSVLAYQRDSGDIEWASGDGTHAYSSIQRATIAGVDQLLSTSNVGIQAFVPETGQLLWTHQWPINTNPRCVQPLVADENSILIGTAGGKGTRRIRVDHANNAWDVNEEWTTRDFKPYFNDFVYHNGYCYGFDGKRFTCIDAATGERMWKGGGYGGQVLLLPDMETLLVLSEKGDIVLLEASSDGENVLEKFKVLDGKTWNHPVIANGRLFVRNAREMACFELPA